MQAKYVGMGLIVLLGLTVALECSAQNGYPGDADRNQFVNGSDFRTVRDHFGEATWGIGDANADGFVNGNDFRAVRDYFGSSYCGALRKTESKKEGKVGKVHRRSSCC